MDNQNIQTDVLIIGSGIAGCIAALKASEHFGHVVLATKEKLPENSNSYYAQGGIIFRGENDSVEKLVEDIIYAGGGINRREAARVLAQEGPELVQKILIDKFGIEFSAGKTGELDLTEEGGHHTRRIIHYQDRTGNKIETSLIQAIQNTKNIELLTDTMVVDLMSSTHHSSNPIDIYEETEILGAYALRNGQMIQIRSLVTILATGGIGNIYLHSTNPELSTGDGIAMAYRAGARIVNMEYTQFHPTTLYHKDSKRFLISESVRGEGAILKNKNLEPFMARYHEMKDLAPRDIVTRAILTEMTENKQNYVYLDLSPIGNSKVIKNRFPHIYETCMELGIDITKDLLTVVPAYHFSCGGVLTDTWGKTTLKRLFAIGEVSCTGLHGANRLASTSLLEGLTYGARAISYIKEQIKEYSKQRDFDIPDWTITGKEAADKALIMQDWSSIKNIMWNYVGPIRSSKRLARAQRDLNQLAETIEVFYRDCYPDRNIVELRNGVQTAQVVALSAWKNKKSIGSHYRED